MTLEMPRRGFLLGASALIVAPSIVRATSLMQVKVFDKRCYRYIEAYCVGTDSIAARIDVAYGKLALPRVGEGYARLLTEGEVRTGYFRFAGPLLDIPLEVGQQKAIMWRLSE